MVPIHPGSLPIILRRIKGPDGSMKKADGYLFDELTTPREDSAMERGQPITKAFGRLRQKLGIDERIEGQRQATWTYTPCAAGSSPRPETPSTGALKASPCTPWRRSWGTRRGSWGYR